MERNYEYIIRMMERNDPNGEYSVEGIKKYPWVYLDILQSWFYNCGASNAPGWLIMAIRWMESVTV